MEGLRGKFKKKMSIMIRKNKKSILFGCVTLLEVKREKKKNKTKLKEEKKSPISFLMVPFYELHLPYCTNDQVYQLHTTFFIVDN